MEKSQRILSREGLGLGEGLPLQVSSGGIEDLRRDIQRLMDMEAIRLSKHVYFRALDCANWAELETVLHPDLHVHYIGGGYEFKLDGAQAFIAAMTQAFHKRAAASHHAVHPEIRMISDTEATGVWYLRDHFWHLDHKHCTQGAALYWDRYEKVEGRWVIRETRYERVYQFDESVEGLPEPSAHYLARAGGEPPG